MKSYIHGNIGAYSIVAYVLKLKEEVKGQVYKSIITSTEKTGYSPMLTPPILYKIVSIKLLYIT